MTPDQFAGFAARGYNRVPVAREVLADFDTPLSAYAKVASGPYSYLLESMQGGEKWGRYSIIGLPARERVQVFGQQVAHVRGESIVEAAEVADPLAWVQEFRGRFRVPQMPHLPRFCGGLVGYFGYDTVRYIEPRLGPCPNPDLLGTPDILLTVSDEVLVFDNLRGTIYVVVHADPEPPDALQEATARVDELVARLRRPLPEQGPELPTGAVADVAEQFAGSFTQEGYEAAVERIRRYIVDGDVMQVVPSQRMSIPFSARPLDLYRALRFLNPSPYMFHLDLAEFQVVGASPEVLARLENGLLTVRPIAGTRPRGRTADEDRALEKELLADPKERAEHLMLIDLGRNDVGRVAVAGTVEVTEQMAVERYSHVMHIVSNVQGHVREGLDAIDALRATFPAGTLSGAPKIRAMEIIDELEPVKRGVYSGAVGYIGWNGNMDSAIAIRTAVIKDGELHAQAGGGIVADSVPALEWEETLNKRRALFRAVAMVQAAQDG